MSKTIADSGKIARYFPDKEGERAADWLAKNVPLFECPDSRFEEVYYHRWHTYAKHLKHTADGFIVTEFLPDVSWAGKHNSINAAAGHHFYEGRWLRHAEQYLDDYAVFWYRKGGSLRSYSSWLADAILAYATVIGDMTLPLELLPDMAQNYAAWEQSNRHESGLFWSCDDRDAMEFSISGSGLRPTLNSYMYADAKAISELARLADDSPLSSEFQEKTERLKKLVQRRLWDEEDGFFKCVPLDSVKADAVWRFDRVDPARNVREEIGFIPWYFSLPDKGYECAWRQLVSEEGFLAPYGPTTAERRHPRFQFAHQNHECLWNGPSWPFATSQTLTAMANLLDEYEQDAVTKTQYFETLERYVQCHYRTESDGTRVFWIDENIDPFTGRWLSRDILESWGWRADKGGYERGRDYNHSTFCDLIITGLVGLRPRNDDTLELRPLLPEGCWNYFLLEDVSYRRHSLTILYDRTGEHYKRGKGLLIYIDGVLAKKSDGLYGTETRL